MNHSQNATFVCYAYGIPIPNITWVKVAEKLTVLNSSNVVKITEQIVSTSQQESVPFPNVTWVKRVDESMVLNSGSGDSIEITEPIIDNPWRESVLTFLSTVATDESVYQCQGTNGVTNVIGFPMNDTVRLIILGKHLVTLVY